MDLRSEMFSDPDPQIQIHGSECRFQISDLVCSDVDLSLDLEEISDSDFRSEI